MSVTSRRPSRPTTYLHPGESPRLGVDYDEMLAGRFPYERGYLPVNRKLDGTMWNW